jgi:hypothetical protein
MHALETLQTGGLIAQDMSEAPISRFPGLRSTLGEGWIMIFDRVAPPNLPERGTSLVLGAPGDGMVEKPTLVDWDRDAPPNQRVDYGGLLLRKSRILKGTPLLSAIEGPVAVWSSRGGRATVELGFPLEESDIAARPAFLLMLINLVEWGPARALRSFPYEVRMGEALRPLRRLWMESGELGFRYADHVERVDVTAGRPRTALSFGPGFVRASAANRTEWIAVNLFDAEESDLREPPEAPLGVALPPPAPWHAKVPYAVLAISAVLALFVLEWLLYQRGWV